MTQLLIRSFVKRPDAVKDPAVRMSYGRLAGLVGIFCNLLLFAGKFAVGSVFGSIAITADAMNNLSDASGNVVSLLGFRLSSIRPDKNHPYGHARFEYLASLMVSVMVLSIGMNLLSESVEKVFHPQQILFSWLSAVVLVVSMAVKFWLGRFNETLGRAIDSDTLLAAAADSRSDVLATLGVLAGSLLVQWTRLPVLDGVMGLVVACLILWSGWGLVKDTLSPLLGESPDPALVKAIQEKVLSYPNVMGIHDLMIHDYGPGHQFVTLHVEFPAEMDVLDAHDMVDNIEQDFWKEQQLQVTIHYDPIVTADPRVHQARTQLAAALQEIDPALSLHDLRLVPGKSHTNIVFDLVSPAGYAGNKEAVMEKLRQTAAAIDPDYRCVIKEEQAYCG